MLAQSNATILLPSALLRKATLQHAAARHGRNTLVLALLSTVAVKLTPTSPWNRTLKLKPLATADTRSTWTAMPCEKGTGSEVAVTSIL